MDVTADDIARLRAAKMSDDTILEKLGQYDPSSAGDIKKLQDHGLNAGQILDKYVQYRTKYPSKPADTGESLTTKALNAASLMGKAVAYGAGDEASRIGATLHDTGISSGDIPKEVGAAASGIANEQTPYDPASGHVGLSLNGLSYVPRALAESAPSIAGYGTAGAIAGLPGAALYGLLRHLGRTADERAANNGRSEATTGDVLGAVPSAAAQALLDAAGSRMVFGAGLAPVKGVGLKALGTTGANITKTGVANAGLGAASDVANQLGTSVGTDKGATLDPAEVAQATQSAGVLAGAQRGLGSIPEAVTSVRLRGLSPTERYDSKYAKQVSNDINSTQITGDADNPSDISKIVTNGSNLYKQQVNDVVSKLKASQKAADEAGDSAASEAIGNKLDKVSNLMMNLKTSSLDHEQVVEAKSELPDSLLDPLMRLHTIKKLGEQAGAKDKSIPTKPSVFDMIRLAHEAKRMAFVGGVASAALGQPMGVALAAIPTSAYVGSKVAQLGLRTPYTIKDFADRFGGPEPTQVQTPQWAPMAEPKQLPPPSAIQMPPPVSPEPVNRGVGLNDSWEPQGPHQPITDPRLLLNPPPIIGGDARQQGPVSRSWKLFPPKAPVSPGTPLSVSQNGVWGNLADSTAQEVSPADLVKAAKAYRKRAGVTKVSEAATPPKAKEAAPEPPQAQQTAPQAEPQAPAVSPAMVKIDTASNSRMQAMSDVRKSLASIGAGMEYRTQLRNEIIDSVDNLPLSKAGKALWSQNKEGFKARVNSNNTPTAAAGHSEVTSLTSKFSPLDKTILDHHFINGKTKDGRHFLDAWKHATDSKLRAAKALNKAVHKANETKHKRGHTKKDPNKV